MTGTFETHGDCPDCGAPMNIDTRGEVGEIVMVKRVVEDGSYVRRIELDSRRIWRSAHIATCSGCEFSAELI